MRRGRNTQRRRRTDFKMGDSISASKATKQIYRLLELKVNSEMYIADRKATTCINYCIYYLYIKLVLLRCVNPVAPPPSRVLSRQSRLRIFASHCQSFSSHYSAVGRVNVTKSVLNIYLYIYIYIYLYLSIYLSISVCLSVYLSICLSIYLSI